VLSERIRLLGVNRSGAYEHYNLLLQRGFPIPAYEVAILDLVRSRLPNLRSYHEIGSGLGTLPLMLAYEGFAAVGVERDEPRHLTATTVLRELSAQFPHVESNCRLLGAAFPDAVADLDVSDSLAILTDFVSSQTPSEYVRLCRDLAQYRYVLLDLQRFCNKRESQAEQDQLVEELAGYGLSSCPDFIDLGGLGYYRLFECKSPRVSRVIADRRAQAAAARRVDAQPAATTTVPASEYKAQVPATTARSELTPAPSGDLPATAPPPETPAPLRGVVLPPMPQQARRSRFGGLLGLSALLVIGIPAILAVVYYVYLASNQYVTTFQFAVRGPSMAAATGRAAATVTSGVGAMSPDAFVITDYINSQQAITDVEREVDLRTMFSKSGVDFLSRLPPNVTSEQLSAYWTHMVWAHFDLVSGNVSVSVRAFTPPDSLRLSQALIAASNEVFRRLNLQAQQDFVRVADDNLRTAQEQLNAARKALLAFREKSGLMELDRTSQAGSAIIDDLRKQLAGFQAQYASIKGTSPNSPILPGLAAQITALEGQIKNSDRLAASSPVKVVTAETLGEYQTLDMERQFTEKQYTEALALRNQAYLTAQNQQSYLALFVEPTLPQTSIYPERVRSILTVVLVAAAVWFIGVLIIYAVRDHLM
jgi:capsular polysaccharide transport system permease protein